MTDQRWRPLFVALLAIVGVVALTTVAEAAEVQDETYDDTYYDDTYYDDTYYDDTTNTTNNDPYADDTYYSDDTTYDPYADDTYYSDDTTYDPYADDTYYSDDTTYDPYADDTTYNDPCDPAYHPDPANDPYCTPSPTYSVDDSNFCDPQTHPGWVDDPYCNPDAGTSDSTAVTPRATSTPLPLIVLADRDTPLTELEADEAPIVGAGRMLLAIDAIAELAGFERAVTPAGATLLRDIRDGIPAEGLDEAGYISELETFVDDFTSFLEALEADGVVVSDSLWEAAEALEFALAESATDDVALSTLEPRPWLLGIADLLVRGGETGVGDTHAADEVAIRELLAAFTPREVEDEPVETDTATTEATTPPVAMALETPTEAVVEEPTSGSLLPLIGAGAGVLGLGLIGFVLARRRSKEDSPEESQTDSHGASSTAEPASASEASSPGRTAAKASVSELLDASRRMSASLDTTAIASIALSEAMRIVDAEGGIVVRRTDSGLDPVGCEPPMLFNYEHIADGCLPRVIETGQSIALIATDEPLLVDVPMAVAAVPIVTDGVVTGAILVVRISARPFGREELDALEMLAPLAGSAFAVADTHETATELIDVEPLTGLQNRRRLDLDLASISTDDEVAYLMVDIDHFKNFNDTNGHAAGDEALRRVSAILQASVRPKDLVYRYGGEEFCVLLPGASAADASVVAERARAAVESAEIPGMENQPAGVVTVSIGVSDSAFGLPNSLVERADAALYESKRNGRNRVTISTAD